MIDGYETPEETATRLGISKSQVRNLCRQERFDPPAANVSGRWLIPTNSNPRVTGLGRPPNWYNRAAV